MLMLIKMSVLHWIYRKSLMIQNSGHLLRLDSSQEVPEELIVETAPSRERVSQAVTHTEAASG